MNRLNQECIEIGMDEVCWAYFPVARIAYPHFRGYKEGKRSFHGCTAKLLISNVRHLFCKYKVKTLSESMKKYAPQLISKPVFFYDA